MIESKPGAPAIAAKQWAILEKFAALGHASGVKIIAVQWPILKASFDFLNSNPGYHELAGVWRELRSAQTAAKLRAMGIDFFDVTGLPSNDDSRFSSTRPMQTRWVS